MMHHTQATPQGKETLFVGNLSYFCTNRALSELFACYGVVFSAVVRRSKRNVPLHYGFVEIGALEATAAIRELNGREFMGRKLRVSLRKGFSEEAPIYSNFVSLHLSFVTSMIDMVIDETYLSRVFRPLGGLADCVVKHHVISQRREKQGGYAFLYYADQAAAEHIVTVLRQQEGLLQGVTYDCKFSCTNNPAQEEEQAIASGLNVVAPRKVVHERTQGKDEKSSMTRSSATLVQSYDADDSMTDVDSLTPSQTTNQMRPDLRPAPLVMQQHKIAPQLPPQPMQQQQPQQPQQPHHQQQMYHFAPVPLMPPPQFFTTAGMTPMPMMPFVNTSFPAGSSSLYTSSTMPTLHIPSPVQSPDGSTSTTPTAAAAAAAAAAGAGVMHFSMPPPPMPQMIRSVHNNSPPIAMVPHHMMAPAPHMLHYPPQQTMMYAPQQHQQQGSPLHHMQQPQPNQQMHQHQPQQMMYALPPQHMHHAHPHHAMMHKYPSPHSN